MPWSRWTRFVIGINYLGIPDFNNANEQATSVSGNNLLLTGSVIRLDGGYVLGGEKIGAMPKGVV